MILVLLLLVIIKSIRFIDANNRLDELYSDVEGGYGGSYDEYEDSYESDASMMNMPMISDASMKMISMANMMTTSMKMTLTTANMMTTEYGKTTSTANMMTTSTKTTSTANMMIY